MVHRKRVQEAHQVTEQPQWELIQVINLSGCHLVLGNKVTVVHLEVAALGCRFRCSGTQSLSSVKTSLLHSTQQSLPHLNPPVLCEHQTSASHPLSLQSYQGSDSRWSVPSYIRGRDVADRRYNPLSLEGQRWGRHSLLFRYKSPQTFKE